MRKSGFRSFALAAAVIFALSSGCTRPVNRAAERRIREALPELIGPARQYQARVDSPWDRTLHGRLRQVTIEGLDVQLSNGLLLDRLHLELQGVEYDTQRSRLRAIREARFTATVSAPNLDEFLAGESPEEEKLRNIRFALRENQVSISGERVLLGVGVPFRLTGPVRLAGPRRIEIDPDRLTVIGIPFTGIALRFLKGRFESAIDLSSLPFPIALESAQVGDGALTLTGSADTTALLRLQGTAR